MAVGPSFKETIGEAADGILHGFPVPPVGKDTYDAYLRFVGKEPAGQVQNPYGCAGYDQINLLLLAIERAGSPNVDEIKEHVRRSGNGPGARLPTFHERRPAPQAGRPS